MLFRDPGFNVHPEGLEIFWTPMNMRPFVPLFSFLDDQKTLKGLLRPLLSGFGYNKNK